MFAIASTPPPFISYKENFRIGGEERSIATAQNSWSDISGKLGIAQDEALGGTLGLASRSAPDSEWAKATQLAEEVGTKANVLLSSGLGIASDSKAGVPTDIAVASNLAALAPLVVVSIPMVASVVAASPIMMVGAGVATVVGGLRLQHVTENTMLNNRYGE